MRAGELELLSDEAIRGMLRRGVDHHLRRELECELSWRQARGDHGNNRPPQEYLPAWLLASALSERSR